MRKVAPSLEVNAFRDGQAAIDSLKRWLLPDPPALPLAAFVDIRMPHVNGLELLAWIRRHRVFDFMAVAMLTSSAALADIAAARKHGAQCYLSKHIREPDVLAVLEAARAHAADPGTRFVLSGNLMG